MRKLVDFVLFRLCCAFGGIKTAKRFRSGEKLLVWVHDKRNTARMKKRWPPREYACDMNLSRKCVLVYKLRCGSLQSFFRRVALRRGYIFRSFLRNGDSEAVRAE